MGSNSNMVCSSRREKGFNFKTFRLYGGLVSQMIRYYCFIFSMVILTACIRESIKVHRGLVLFFSFLFLFFVFCTLIIFVCFNLHVARF